VIFNKVAIFGESSIGWSMVVREDLRTYPGEWELSALRRIVQQWA
jgi:hypothetical protein